MQRNIGDHVRARKAGTAFRLPFNALVGEWQRQAVGLRASAEVAADEKRPVLRERAAQLAAEVSVAHQEFLAALDGQPQSIGKCGPVMDTKHAFNNLERLIRGVVESLQDS